MWLVYFEEKMLFIIRCISPKHKKQFGEFFLVFTLEVYYISNIFMSIMKKANTNLKI